MLAVVADDDIIQNKILENQITKNKNFSVKVFTNTDDAMTFLLVNKADVIFVSLCSDKVDYKKIINYLKWLNNNTLTFLIGNNTKQSVAVYENKCDYFIKKPYCCSEINGCLERIELLARRLCKNIYVHTFGRFDIFVNDQPLNFHNSKAKELFALCIDHRGGVVTMYEAIDKLWPERVYDDKVKKLYRKAIMTINKTFSTNNISEIFVTSRASCHIKSELIECDYFNFLENPKKYAVLFNGEYLFDYSWGEETLARLIGNFHSRFCD